MLVGDTSQNQAQAAVLGGKCNGSLLDIFENPYGAPRPTEPKTPPPSSKKKEIQKKNKSLKIPYFPKSKRSFPKSKRYLPKSKRYLPKSKR